MPVGTSDDEIIVRSTYDLVLALANERAVRGSLQARQLQVLLHATTSANWQAQFHRHLADRDDCIDCRIPPNAPRLLCASSIVGSSGELADAALPFLSAAAALLLAAGLGRLQEGSLPALPYNFAALDLASPQPRCQKLFHPCHVGCRVRRWGDDSVSNPASEVLLLLENTPYLDDGVGDVAA